MNGVPIVARPVGAITRTAMWCRRNKALAGLAALLILALVGGLGGVTWKWREADHERSKAEAVNDLLTQRLLAQASLEHDPLARNLTIRELLDRAAAQLGGWLEGEPEIEAKVRETIGSAYLSLGQYDQAETQFRTAVRLDTQYHGARHRDTLRTINLLATLLDQTNHGADAEPLLRRNLKDCQNQLGRDDPITLDAAERLGTLLWHLGKNDEAETALKKNVDDRSRVLKPEHPDTLRSTYLLEPGLARPPQVRRRRSFCLSLCSQRAVFSRLESPRQHSGPDQPGATSSATRGSSPKPRPFYRQAAVEAERILGNPTSINSRCRSEAQGAAGPDASPS